MTVRLIMFMVVACLVIDYLVRQHIRRLQAEHDRLEREKSRAAPVRLEFSEGTKSLKRVEMDAPKARILAVDDEQVVLDSFRRILAPEGYSIDTVLSGPEALSLLRRGDYDFVFTDLKMPDMDGVEVAKAARHLRPDVDVVVITAYGTIETAVETMKTGACEYLQKPFSADELAEYVHKLVIKRQARRLALRQPTLRVALPGLVEGAPAGEDVSQAGSFLADGHTWAWIEPDGYVRIGIDAFAQEAAGSIGEVLLPRPGLEVLCGAPLFSFKRGAEELRFLAPVSGHVLDLNENLNSDPSAVSRSPYQDGWICRMDPSDLAHELGRLKIGGPAQDWCGQELDRLQALRRADPDPDRPLSWTTLAQEFFSRTATIA